MLPLCVMKSMRESRIHSKLESCQRIASLSRKQTLQSVAIEKNVEEAMPLKIYLDLFENGEKLFGSSSNSKCFLKVNV